MSNITRSRRKGGWQKGAAFSWLGFDSKENYSQGSISKREMNRKLKQLRKQKQRDMRISQMSPRQLELMRLVLIGGRIPPNEVAEFDAVELFSKWEEFSQKDPEKFLCEVERFYEGI
jgi:hypothetical protein